MKEFLDHKKLSRKLFKLDTFNRFMDQNKNKYPLSKFDIENIPKNDNLIKDMQDCYYEALVERFGKISFSKCDNSTKSDDGEKLLIMINNHKDLNSTALAEKRFYAVPYFDHMFENRTCTICCEQFIDNKLVLELNCKHAFHFSCICKRLKIKSQCPHCEESIVFHRRTEYEKMFKLWLQLC
ncbi:hypothetical protein HELRODRAFT_184318 [Helobdella robusta]|uniref:RING-type E3 ubiquitin transferase n=1 Tax=Helobdella robusta TaxID=6412 RepID=T1EVD4_HELRO|nr:hypothetical protein HELRODRAFT_184318 [Helobdella robusta]XP_009027590.1 hypothetical protein HELRODRAFT_164393 [Helobdella robusta]ESN94537.1 hypothetical protein HELRODRAFT_164393 [Helobdella robusta]ESO01472.1 hypothetical protein HELRODRAFT_184318 [Helobdella robusta]